MNGPPTTLGQYQIIREIARSNDIVYEAYDPLMNRRVAIKELAVPPGATQQQRDERISRFKREAQAAGTLNHPHIMTVFSFAEDNGRTFMAMEYLDGSTLRNEIDTKGFIPVARAIEIASQVLDGLAHAHSKGVIHRDIKPDNIQILSTGQIKITDFGIARLTFQPNLTMDGQVFGTPSYMSPEQVVGKDIDARSDLFSVAVVLYEMLSGQKPFSGDSVVSITYAIMNNDPPKPQQCPQVLWEVLRRALDKSPMVRYGSAQELAKALSDAERHDQMNAGDSNQLFNSTPNYQTGQYQAQAGGYQQPVAPAPQYTFNPYSNTATPHHPYGGGNPGQHIPPPQQASPYNYNHQGGYGQGPYGPHNTMPPPGYPIYYPPPPRQPLLKPETADFLKRLVIALIVIGTLFTLIFFGFQAGVSVWKNRTAEQQDAEILNTIQVDPRMPTVEKIEVLERARAQMASESARARVDHDIAVLLAELGQSAEQRGNTVEAEALYQKAIEKDPRNSPIYSRLAKLYEVRALAEADTAQKLSLLLQSAENWQMAFNYESDEATKRTYGEGAAQAYYAYARGLAQIDLSGNRQAVRTALYEARACADRSSPLFREINTLLDEVR